MRSGFRPALRRAVIVEDDPSLRSSVESWLQEEGWSVTGCSTLEAAEAITRDAPTLLVLDILIGERSGGELLAQLACRADAPVTVIISAVPDAERLAQRYGLPLVRKPFALDELSSVIDAALDADRRPSLGHERPRTRAT